jgi:hypothetical protein
VSLLTPFLIYDQIFSFFKYDYMSSLIKKFYVLKKYLNLDYSDFLIMPVYMRESLIDIFLEEKNPKG